MKIIPQIGQFYRLNPAHGKPGIVKITAVLESGREVRYAHIDTKESGTIYAAHLVKLAVREELDLRRNELEKKVQMASKIGNKKKR